MRLFTGREPALESDDGIGGKLWQDGRRVAVPREAAGDGPADVSLGIAHQKILAGNSEAAGDAQRLCRRVHVLERQNIQIQRGRILRHPVHHIGPLLPVRSHDRAPGSDSHFQMLGRRALDLDDLIDIAQFLDSRRGRVSIEVAGHGHKSNDLEYSP